MERIIPELELYTIPSYSSWFSWINIHEVERFSLREFFDGSSITRTPRIYKEYRDFIISKYREDPSRKLTFTEVRKSLVGDLSYLLKVFTFLEKWGLINFNVSGNNNERISDSGGSRSASFWVEEEEDDWRGKVKVEEGAPHGVRVVAAPNSMKPIIPPPPPPSMAVDGGGIVGAVGESGFKWPSLASYSDVYGELMLQEERKKGGTVCGSCKDNCGSACYEYTKDPSYILCEKCFKSGNYEDKSADEFTLKDTSSQAAVWTEAELLLLIESALKHGDDWDLVAKSVQTKSKLECISKLIQLPLGDLMLGVDCRKNRFLDVIGDVSNSKQSGLASNESHESVKAEVASSEYQNMDKLNGDASCEGPPLKRLRNEPTSDSGCSLMKQVTCISTMLGPHVMASAADAAVTSLCYENQCSKELFDDGDGNYVYSNNTAEASDPKSDADDDNEVEGKSPNRSETAGESSLKNIIPLNLRKRAATATALGVAAANAKLLASQEEREMGQLVATMIEAQLKKLQRKVKYFEDLELIMENENAQLDELEESLVAERLDVLQRVFDAGISRSNEHNLTKL